MSWEKVDYRGLWFHLPIRSGDPLMNQINHKKSEFLALKPGWLLEEDNSKPLAVCKRVIISESSLNWYFPSGAFKLKFPLRRIFAELIFSARSTLIQNIWIWFAGWIWSWLWLISRQTQLGNWMRCSSYWKKAVSRPNTFKVICRALTRTDRGETITIDIRG